MQIDQIIIYLIAIVYIFTVIAVVYNVIMENKNPIKTLAWIIIIITIPILGFIFYANLGINYRKRKMFSRKSIGDIKWLKYMNEKNRQFVKKSALLDSKELCDVKKLITLLLNNSKAMLTLHNKVDILNNGIETFPAIFESIKNAKKYIHIEYYIIEEGELANKLKKLLIEKVKNSVKVRFIYDDVGSWNLSKNYVRELREAGVSIYAFSPVKFWHFKTNY
ncbi:MAG: PLDc N-terminal domain-containing protein, partial [Bacilli bacterium]